MKNVPMPDYDPKRSGDTTADMPSAPDCRQPMDTQLNLTGPESKPNGLTSTGYAAPLPYKPNAVGSSVATKGLAKLSPPLRLENGQTTAGFTLTTKGHNLHNLPIDPRLTGTDANISTPQNLASSNAPVADMGQNPAMNRLPEVAYPIFPEHHDCQTSVTSDQIGNGQTKYPPFPTTSESPTTKRPTHSFSVTPFPMPVSHELLAPDSAAQLSETQVPGTPRQTGDEFNKVDNLVLNLNPAATEESTGNTFSAVQRLTSSINKKAEMSDGEEHAMIFPLLLVPGLRNCLRLDAIFPGRNFNRSTALGGKMNRFEQELCRDNSSLNRRFTDSYLNNRCPMFTTRQLITLALLGHEKRSASVEEILHWIVKHFLFFRNLIIDSYVKGPIGRPIPGFSLKKDVEDVLNGTVGCYDVDFPPMGYVLEEEVQIVASTDIDGSRYPNIPPVFKYFLPCGFENLVFSPYYQRGDYIGAYPYISNCGIMNKGCQWSTLEPNMDSLAEKKFHIYALMRGDKEGTFSFHHLNGHNHIKQKILNYVLSIKEPLVIQYQKEYSAPVNREYKMLVSVEVPHTLVTSVHHWLLPPPQELLAPFLVSKEFKYYASRAFYGSNHFKANTHGRSRHIIERWLRRIGPSNIINLTSVEFDLIIGRPWGAIREYEDAFKLLGYSCSLKGLVLHMNTGTLPQRAKKNVELVPGFRTLVKFRGLREVQVLGWDEARNFLVRRVTPWVVVPDPIALRIRDDAWQYTGPRYIQEKK